MANAAAVVYVYLEDADKTVSVDDIKEWLQFIDKVVEMKLQYDAASKQTCYSVEFRSPNSAQQAVQYLNGARFKNCVVTIKSRVFTAVEPVTSTASSPTPSGTTAATKPALATRKRCRATAELPSNHLLPEDLQMDQLLVEQLPDASTSEGFSEVTALWEKLKSSQEQLVAAYKALDATKEELTAADAMLARLLGVHQSNDAKSGRDDRSGEEAGTGSYPLAARRCVSHQRGISVEAATPISIVSLVTATFGPLAFCTVTTAQREFFLVLKFVFAADEERFLAATTAVSSSSGGDGKAEAVAARTEKERMLISLSWSAIDFNISSRDFAAQWPLDAARQQALRERLTRLLSR